MGQMKYREQRRAEPSLAAVVPGNQTWLWRRPPNNPNAAELLPSEQLGLIEPEETINNQRSQAGP